MTAATQRRNTAADSAAVFAALGDATRLRLVARLCEGGPQSVTRLTHGADVTRQAIAKHLTVLEGAGLVRVTRRGRERVWRLDPARLEETRRYLDAISSQWDAAIGRLEAYLEQSRVRKPRRSR